MVVLIWAKGWVLYGVLGVKVGFIGWFILKRPFDRVKDMVLEAVNKGIYLVLVLLLFYFREEDRWTGFNSHVYIWIMVGNCIVSVVISFGKVEFINF